MLQGRGVGKVTRQSEFKELGLVEREVQDRIRGRLTISKPDGPTE